MLVLRPKPTDADVRAMATGADQKGLRKYGPSRSWWDRGAVIVDEAGPAVVDANGWRVPIPVPPDGGKICEHRSAMNGGGMPGRSWTLVMFHVCDRDGRALAALPADGFTGEDYQRLARAAGLGYEVQRAGRVPAEVPGFVTLLVCVNEEESHQPHRKGWLTRKLIGGKDEWSPYFGGRTYPPMDPAYLRA